MRSIIWILLAILAGSLTAYLWTRFESHAPDIETHTSAVFVGQEHTHEFKVTDRGAGIEQLRIWLAGEDKEIELYNQSFPGNVFQGAVPNTLRAAQVTIRPKELGLSDGKATLNVEARDWSWSPNTTLAQVPIIVDTRSPRVRVETGLVYVRRGGTELVAYRIDEKGVEHWVELGDQKFRGYPHPEDETLFLAFYGLPPVKDGVRPRIIARDKAGNVSRAPVSIEIIERSFPDDVIALSDGFMERKVGELTGSYDGKLVDAYLEINREMRKENNAKIREVCSKTSPERLWSGAFLQLPNSRVGARFAEHRSYQYAGEEVDTQTHMGYDVASTAHASVPAANDGIVVFAEPLGIYGNTVILDHGMGLFSLYGHLSSFDVDKGQAVGKGDSLGTTGTTGLAGGDHLHFAILVGGVFVDPLEWLDGRWIEEHIEPEFDLTGGEEEIEE